MGKLRIIDRAATYKVTKADRHRWGEESLKRSLWWERQKEGKAAFQREERRRAAPYPAGTDERKAWVQGWDWGYSNWVNDQKDKRMFGDYAAWPRQCPWRLRHG